MFTYLKNCHLVFHAQFGFLVTMLGSYQSFRDCRRIAQKVVLGSVASVSPQWLPTSTRVGPLTDTAQTQPSFPVARDPKVACAWYSHPARQGFTPTPAAAHISPSCSQSWCSGLAVTPGWIGNPMMDIKPENQNILSTSK